MCPTIPLIKSTIHSSLLILINHNKIPHLGTFLDVLLIIFCATFPVSEFGYLLDSSKFSQYKSVAKKIQTVSTKFKKMNKNNKNGPDNKKGNFLRIIEGKLGKKLIEFGESNRPIIVHLLIQV